MKKQSSLTLYLFLLMTALIIPLVSCHDDDVPPAENEEEIINEITLTFSPVGGGESLMFTYLDGDGDGTIPAEQDKIILSPDTEYNMEITLKNTVADKDENITEEVAAESYAHLFFFSWTNGLFTSPSGDGNIGTEERNDPLNYQDEDRNGLPVGISTRWITTGIATTGTFRVILKHQPDIKSVVSTTEDGESDVDLEWDLIVR